MLSLALLVLSIGIADSVNPSTVGPALYLALGRNAVRRLAEFTAGVFAVYLVGGIVLTLGPGAALPHPGAHTRRLVEEGLGVALMLFAAGLWVARRRVARHLAQEENRIDNSPLLLGIGIMVIELPTAFPYFAAIAAILAAGRNALQDVLLLLVFNAAFIAPVLVVLGLRTLAGERGVRSLEAMRASFDRRAAVILPVLALAAGAILLLIGMTS